MELAKEKKYLNGPHHIYYVSNISSAYHKVLSIWVLVKLKTLYFSDRTIYPGINGILITKY